MRVYLEGMIFGVPLIFLVGPVFLTLLHASLLHGRAAGLSVAVGIAVSDAFCIGICALGLGPFLLRPAIQHLSLWVGGLFLIAFGSSLLLRKPTLPTLVIENETDVEALEGAVRPEADASKERPAIAEKASLGAFALQGFLVNFINPFVLSFWIGSLSAISSRYRAEPWAIGWFFAGTVTVIFVTDSLKALLAAQVKRSITLPRLVLFHRIAGLGLLFFGLRLLWTLFRPL